MTKIYIGSDHAGYKLKEALKSYIEELKHTLEDKGAFSFNPEDDYPDFVKPVAEAVALEAGSLGIILGKSGQGEAVCANRTEGIRAVVYYGGNQEILKLSREHNDANVLSLGAGFLNEEEAKQAVKLWLETTFSNDERHIRRIKKL